MEKVMFFDTNGDGEHEVTIKELCNDSIGLGGEDEDRLLSLEQAQHYDTCGEFLDLFENVSTPEFIEWNLVVFQRVAQHKVEVDGAYTGEYEDDCYGEFLILQQRRGELLHCYVNLITDQDASRLYKYLEQSWIQNVQYWHEID